MSRKVGIIGIGNVGSTIVHHIVVDGLADDLVMIDKNTKKVNADAEDLIEALPNLPYHVNISVNDFSALKDANVVISSVGHIAIQLQHPDRYKELPFNLKQATVISKRLRTVGFNGILIDISNPCDIITARYQEVTGLPKAHVMGTGTLLDTARMKVAVGRELHIDPRSVQGFNLGEHGNTQFTAFSTVRVLGQPIAKIAKQKHLSIAKIDEDARQGGNQIMLGKHHTNFAVAAAAVRLMNVVLSDAQSELSVSHFCKDYGNYMSTPVIVRRNGIGRSIHLNLTAEEQKKLKRSSDFIKRKSSEYEN